MQQDSGFDLVISMFNVGEVDVFHLAQRIKEIQSDIPVVLLTNFSRDIGLKIEREDTSAIDYIFYWHGNPDLILTIIKLIEDRMNADADILGFGVQAILLVLSCGSCGEAYNIADPRYQMTIRDFAFQCAKLGGCKVVFENPSDLEARGYSTISRSVLNAEKLLDLGWKPNCADGSAIYETIKVLRELFARYPDTQ